jgi:hypothetical protein
MVIGGVDTTGKLLTGNANVILSRTNTPGYFQGDPFSGYYTEHFDEEQVIARYPSLTSGTLPLPNATKYALPVLFERTPYGPPTPNGPAIGPYFAFGSIPVSGLGEPGRRSMLFRIPLSDYLPIIPESDGGDGGGMFGEPPMPPFFSAPAPSSISSNPPKQPSGKVITTGATAPGAKQAPVVESPIESTDGSLPVFTSSTYLIGILTLDKPLIDYPPKEVVSEMEESNEFVLSDILNKHCNLVAKEHEIENKALRTKREIFQQENVKPLTDAVSLIVSAVLKIQNENISSQEKGGGDSKTTPQSPRVPPQAQRPSTVSSNSQNMGIVVTEESKHNLCIALSQTGLAVGLRETMMLPMMNVVRNKLVSENPNSLAHIPQSSSILEPAGTNAVNPTLSLAVELYRDTMQRIHTALNELFSDEKFPVSLSSRAETLTDTQLVSCCNMTEVNQVVMCSPEMRKVFFFFLK